jgi:uncharacterized integral membrane protein
MVNWMKLLYVLVIALLYVPMVFLGANVFFPKFTGTESYFRGTEECYPRYPISEKLAPVEQQALAEEQQAKINECLAEQRVLEQQWNEERSVYNGWKYAAITGFNLVILLLIVFMTFTDAVSMGIFFGTVVTAFAATVSYWDYARTKIGFVLMLITFFVVLFIVNKRARTLIESKLKKKPQKPGGFT